MQKKYILAVCALLTLVTACGGGGGGGGNSGGSGFSSSSITASSSSPSTSTSSSSTSASSSSSSSFSAAVSYSAAGEFVYFQESPGSFNYCPAISLSNGDLLVCFNSKMPEDNDYMQLLVQKYTLKGTKIGKEVIVDKYAYHANFTPLSSGGFAATWWSNEPPYGDFYQLFDNSLSPLAVKKGIYFASQSENTRYAFEGMDGIFTIISDRGPYTITRLSSDGTVSEKALSDTFIGQHIKTVHLKTGGFIILRCDMCDATYSSEPVRIVAQRYDYEGNSVGNAITAPVDTTLYPNWAVSLPDVTALTSGGFVLSWVYVNPSFGFSQSESYLYAQTYDLDNNPKGSVIRADLNDSIYQGYKSLTGLSDGNFVMAWQEAQHYSSVCGAPTIKGRVYSAQGVALSQIMTLASGDYNFWPQVLPVGNDGFALNWRSTADRQCTGFWGETYQHKIRVFTKN